MHPQLTPIFLIQPPRLTKNSILLLFFSLFPSLYFYIACLREKLRILSSTTNHAVTMPTHYQIETHVFFFYFFLLLLPPALDYTFPLEFVCHLIVTKCLHYLRVKRLNLRQSIGSTYVCDACRNTSATTNVVLAYSGLYHPLILSYERERATGDTLLINRSWVRLFLSPSDQCKS